MNYYEIERYKVAVSVSGSELSEAGISIDDILERTIRGWEYLRELKACAIQSTDYEWPGCAYSTEMKVMPENGIVIIFSETVEDFVNGLKNSQKIADHGSILLRELIKRIETTDEEGARVIIRDFEKSIREVNG